MIDVVVKQYLRKQHKRQKYKCSCGHIETALGPVKLLPNGRCSTEFGIGVAVQKYEDHQPLERQVTAMARDGLTVDSQTLWDQLLAMHRVLKPPLLTLREHLNSERVKSADQTRSPVLGKESRNWTVWCQMSEDAVLHEIRRSRNAENGARPFPT
jgi:transposase